MADFKIAADFVLRNEDAELKGEVTPDPTRADPKAVSRFGINSAAHPEAVTDGFYEMSRDAALQYAEDKLKYDYFSPIGGYQINDQAVANKFNDLAVNEGIAQATKIVQRAVNQLLGPLKIGLQVDGKMGQKTLLAINDASPLSLLAEIKEKAKDFYVAVAANNPSKAGKLAGWLARVQR